MSINITQTSIVNFFSLLIQIHILYSKDLEHCVHIIKLAKLMRNNHLERHERFSVAVHILWFASSLFSVKRIYSQVQQCFFDTNIHFDLIKMVFVDLVCASLAPSSVVRWHSFAGRQRIKFTDRTHKFTIFYFGFVWFVYAQTHNIQWSHEDASRPLVPFSRHRSLSVFMCVCVCAWTTKQTIINDTDEIKTYAFIKDNLLIARS